MFRKLIGALVVLALCVSIAMAEELRVVITKVEGDKVTFRQAKGKDGDRPEKTLRVASNAKVVKGKFDKETKSFESSGDIEGGLKNNLFEKIPEKGLSAIIVTEDDKITEVRILWGKKKK